MNYRYKILRRDDSKCIKCNVCETMLSGFISEYEGELLLEPPQYEKEETQRAVEDLINACLGNAISLETVALTDGFY